jgi:hypothetical protein
MNKKITTLTLGALGIVALASACTVDAGEPQTTATSSEAAMCANESATNIVMAGIATSTAMEMKRWLPERDFVFSNGVLSISNWGTARCPRYRPNGSIITDPNDTSYPKDCRYTKRWLALQNDAATGMVIDGTALDAGVLRSRLASYWDRQMVCNSRPDNGQADNCPVEYHDLVFSYKTNGACLDDWWFHTYKQGKTENLAPADAAQLKNKLIWVGYPDNPYLAFGSNYAGDVKIDPGGNTQGGGSGSGSAPVYFVAQDNTANWYCRNNVMEGAVSTEGAVAVPGGQCQCMTSPAQAVTTFKTTTIPGWLKCKP